MRRTRRSSRSCRSTAFRRFSPTRIRRWRFRARSTPKCSRRRSFTMRTARKSGATSATRTGPARRPLGFSRKAAPAKEAEQPPVDRREAERDKAETCEILRGKSFAEEHGAEEDRHRRDQQGHQQRIGRAGMFDQAEVEHISKRGAEDRE